METYGFHHLTVFPLSFKEFYEKLCVYYTIRYLHEDYRGFLLPVRRHTSQSGHMTLPFPFSLPVLRRAHEVMLPTHTHRRMHTLFSLITDEQLLGL